MTVKHGQKFCTTCRTLKPLSEFHPHKTHRFGVDSRCKNCYSELAGQNKRKNRKKVLDSMGGRCVYCGCDIYEALEINHKHGSGSQDPAGKGSRLINAILGGRRKTDDLEVVCEICNTWHKVVKLDGVPDGWTITWEAPQ